MKQNLLSFASRLIFLTSSPLTLCRPGLKILSNMHAQSSVRFFSYYYFYGFHPLVAVGGA